MNVLVLADTHVPDHARALPDALDRHLRWAELILHAGDVTDAAVLDELEAHAPVRAVVGNIDRPNVAARGTAKRLRLELEGVAVAMVHDAGARAGREPRLRSWFPGAAVIVFGHSHQPVNELLDGVRFLNPGSPTWKRRAPQPTVARLVLGSSAAHAELVAL